MRVLYTDEENVDGEVHGESDQSISVWSLGRYLIPRLSSSASTSSGTRPFTRTAYIPRTYFDVLCHRATQLSSGFMTAITPSKWVVVHDCILSGAPLNCIISSQFGQPFRRKSAGVWIREHNRHARSAFARGWGGIKA